MGTFSNTLMRYVCSNSFCMNPTSLLYIDENNDKNLNLLLQCRDANGIDCFTALSTEEGKNFSPKQFIYPPHVPSRARKHVKSSISCNGLLSLDYGGDEVVVWNPSSGNYQLLPRCTPKLVTSSDPDPLFHDFRGSCFGFDPRCNDYKMLRFFVEYFNTGEYSDKPKWKEHVEVYSLKNDLWKELPVPDIVFPTHSHSSVLINGYYYWLGRNPVRSGAMHIHILRYDIANEEFANLPLPDVGSNILGGHRFELLELDGLLSAVVYPRLGIEKCFQVWVMMMNGSWVKEATVNLSGAERPLGFWRKGRYMFFQGLNYELTVFDRVTGHLNNLGIYSCPNFEYPYIYSDPDRSMKLFSHLNNSLALSDLDQATNNSSRTQ